MRILLFIAIIFGNTFFIRAQSIDWDWGSNKVESQNYYNRLKVSVDNKDYAQARYSCWWLLTNAPKLHVNLYKYSSKVYENLQKKELDPKAKSLLQDSALWVYDKRMEVFGDENHVLNLKGKIAWSYLNERPNTSKTLFELYSKIYLLLNEKIYPKSATGYMYAAGKYYKEKKIEKVVLNGVYNNVYNTLTTQINTETSESKKKKAASARDKTERIFTGYAELNCSEIDTIFGNRFRRTNDLATAKRLKYLLAKNKCKNHSLMIDVLRRIEKSEPSAGGSMTIAQYYRILEKPDSALNYYNKALRFSNNNAQKANIHLEMARIQFKKKLYPAAAANAKKTVEYQHNYKVAHELIGDCYFNSYDDCKSDDDLKSRLIFIAAYEHYKLAVNSKKMQQAKTQFPSKEQAFQQSKYEGDKMKIDCWINKEVELKTRD